MINIDFNLAQDYYDCEELAASGWVAAFRGGHDLAMLLGTLGLLLLLGAFEFFKRHSAVVIAI